MVASPAAARAEGRTFRPSAAAGRQVAQNRPEQPVAQNRKAMERLTKASPARPVAARIETD